MRTITLAEVKEMILDIASESPDYRYEHPEWTNGTCVYSDKGAPSCIVGHWMAREDIDLPEWGYASNYGSWMVERTNHATVDEAQFADYLASRGVKLTSAARTFLTTVQYTQDNDMTWLNAFEAADAWVTGEDPNE